jgi:hypothetical protein
MPDQYFAATHFFLTRLPMNQASITSTAKQV